MALLQSAGFLKRYLSAPRQVGAVAPSSRWLARALAAPFAARTEPAHVLEVGAGTGPVTRLLAEMLGSEDRLDICEIDEEFVALLERELLTEGPAAEAHRQGRIRLLHCPVQEIDRPHRYDFVISGLPLTAFEPHLVEAILETVERNLKPGGIFSYFEYVALRRLTSLSPRRTTRRRVRAVSAILDRRIRDHQYERRTVLANIPPAYARHWRFQPDQG